MGDRAQVAIKGNGSSGVYLYGHWIGSDIYKATARALKRVPGRHNDNEYLARAVFCEMISTDGERALLEETGFGIGTTQHRDVEHAIPILDCKTEMISFKKAPYSRGELPEPMSFAEFQIRALAGEFDEL